MSEPNQPGEPKEPYQVVPPASETPTPPPSSATPAASEPRAKSADLKAKLNLAGLLENFEEDADFDKDPELEAKITGKPRQSMDIPPPVPAVLRPEMIQPGKIQPKHWGIAGLVLLIGAAIAAGVYAPNHAVARVLLAMYSTFLHTGTGLVALYMAARLLEYRFGNLELGATRMFTAVGVFTLLMSLHLTPFGEYNALNRALTVIVAMAGYTLTVASTFKLWDKQKLGFVVGFHALLWMVVEVGMTLATTIGDVAASKPA